MEIALKHTYICIHTHTHTNIYIIIFDKSVLILILKELNYKATTDHNFFLYQELGKSAV